MKKLLILAALVAFVSVSGFCGTPNPVGNIQAGSVVIVPMTLAQIDALTPDATGQIQVCSNCKFAICVSTGADSLARGGFVVAASTNPAAAQGAVSHCQ